MKVLQILVYDFIEINLIYILAEGNDEKLDLKGFSEVATATELLRIGMTDDDNIRVFDDIKIFLLIYEVLNLTECYTDMSSIYVDVLFNAVL